MIHAVLLDLDNTMVLFDETSYVEEYFGRLAPRFADLLSEKELRLRVFGATAGLRRNRGSRSNREFFLARFCEGEAFDPVDVWNRFMHFYEVDYPELTVETEVPPGLAEVLERLGRSGLKMVLASNPIFPRIAQEARMGWAAIPAHLFDLYTHIGNMSFVKPDPGYYRQICDMLREPPRNCLMVGNDPSGDMAAKRAGLKTYRTTDAEAAGFAPVSLTDPSVSSLPAAPAPDFSGPLAGILDVIPKIYGADPATGAGCPFGAVNDF